MLPAFFFQSRIFSTLSIVLALSLCSTAHGETHKKAHYNRINLSAEAQTQLPNNLMRVVFFAQAEDTQASKAANQVNKKLSKAQALLKEQSGIDFKTVGYETTPVYKEREIIKWRVKQSLMLESEDLAGMASLMSKLQKTLSIASVRFDATESKKQAVQDQLIIEALQRFEARAQLVQKQLKAEAYELVNIDIITDTPAIRPYAKSRGAAMAMMESAPAAPSFEAGKQTLTVNVQGQVELTR